MPSVFNTNSALRLESTIGDGNATAFSFSLEGTGSDRAHAAHPLVASITAHFTGNLRSRPTPNLLCTIATAAQPGIQLKVIRVKGDGKCMFRAIALGLARNQGRILAADVEQKEADNLRMAVAEALCRTDARRKQFGQAVRALQQEDTLKNYCKRLASPTFWGGEPEMMVSFLDPSCPFPFVASLDILAPRSGPVRHAQGPNFCLLERERIRRQEWIHLYPEVWREVQETQQRREGTTARAASLHGEQSL